MLTWRGAWIALAVEQAGYMLVLVLMLRAVHPRVGSQLRGMQSGASQDALPGTAHVARVMHLEEARRRGESASRGRHAAATCAMRFGRVLSVTGALDGAEGAQLGGESPSGRPSYPVAPRGPPAKVVASSLLSEAVAAGINVRSHVPDEEEEGEEEAAERANHVACPGGEEEGAAQ